MKLLIKEARRNDTLLLTISNFLIKQNLRLTDINNILVENSGEGFTSVRIRVVIANALGYALGIPLFSTKGKVRKKRNIQVIEPIYNAAPNITINTKNRS